MNAAGWIAKDYHPPVKQRRVSSPGAATYRRPWPVSAVRFFVHRSISPVNAKCCWFLPLRPVPIAHITRSFFLFAYLTFTNRKSCYVSIGPRRSVVHSASCANSIHIITYHLSPSFVHCFRTSKRCGDTCPLWCWCEGRRSAGEYVWKRYTGWTWFVTN